MSRGWLIIKRVFLVLALLLNACALLAPRRPPRLNDTTPIGRTPSDISPTTQAFETSRPKDAPARTIRMEIKKIATNTQGYEVEIEAYDQHWKKPYVFRILSEFLRVRLTPGKYKARTRSVGEGDSKGRWSKYFDFAIAYKPPDSVKPPDDSKIEPKGETSERVLFEWPNFHAPAYLFELKNGKGELVKHEIVLKKAWALAEVPSGSKYTWSVSPLVDPAEADRPDLPRKWHRFELLNTPPQLSHIAIQIEKRGKIDLYEFEFVRILKNNETSEPSTYTSREPVFDSRLEPGEYELRARMLYVDGEKTDWSSPSRFFVPYLAPKSLEPRPGEALDPTSEEKAKVVFEWQEFKKASRYVINIFDKDGKIIKRVETSESHITARLPASEDYYWQVAAYTENEPERPPPKTTDETPHFRIETFVKNELEPVEEPSPSFGWGRYIISSASYVGKNFEKNALIHQTILGGAGEFGAGYWHRKSRLGIMGYSSLSGFKITNHNFTYWTNGIQLGYRYLRPDGPRWRFWTGWAWKELPELDVNSVNPEAISFNRLQASGPTIQISFMNTIRPSIASDVPVGSSLIEGFKHRLGYHFMVNYFHGTNFGATPNGKEFLGMESLQLSALGTLSLSQNIKGMLGYSYKLERALYNSTDRSGLQNEVAIDGHYLSLMLEIGLDKFIKKEDE